MSENLAQTIEDTVVELCRQAATILVPEMKGALKKDLSETRTSAAKSQLEVIIEDIGLGKELSRPICQDTGIVAFDIKLGENFPIKASLKKILQKATERATSEVPLRPNTVDFWKGNSGTNVDHRGHIPWFYWDIVEGDALEIKCILKGGGSSNIAQLGMLPPGKGMKGVLEFTLDSVIKAGPKGCPPYVVGVGVGGGEDICMQLAKKAAIRPIGTKNPDTEIAALEDKLLEAINTLDIGVVGVGGSKTAIDVHMEIAGRHPASLPVGVVFSCWAQRFAKAKISASGEVERF
jgi:fumarate hydratase subunit alpha